MDPAPTRYVDREGGAALAYQVVGEGPVDVVTFYDLGQHLDLLWTDPDTHHLFERGARYSRSVYFQRRGLGLSDPITYTPTVEQQADDVLAVMDAVGMRRATLVGVIGSCGPLALVAAKAPERVLGLVLINPLAEGVANGNLHGWTDSELREFVDGYKYAFENWGSGETIGMWDPAQSTPHNRRLMGLLERCSAPPATAMAYYEWFVRTDITDVLRSARAPARVLRVPTYSAPELRCATWPSGCPTRRSTPCRPRHVVRRSARRGVRLPTTSRRWRPARLSRRCRSIPGFGDLHRHRVVDRAAVASRRRRLPRPARGARASGPSGGFRRRRGQR